MIGDCAYGDGATRRAFKEQGCKLVVKVPRGGRPGYFAKGDFKIDLVQDAVTCPTGQMTRKWKLKRVRTGTRGERVAVKQFEFAAEQCRGCAHYRQCVSGKRGQGRTITLHPEEELMQQARAYQETEAFREDIRLRQAAEHRLARLVQLGIRKARYFGRAKVKWQLLLAAAAANLVLVAAWESATGTSPGLGAASFGVPLLPILLLLVATGIAGEVRRRRNADMTTSTQRGPEGPQPNPMEPQMNADGRRLSSRTGPSPSVGANRRVSAVAGTGIGRERHGTGTTEKTSSPKR